MKDRWPGLNAENSTFKQVGAGNPGQIKDSLNQLATSNENTNYSYSIKPLDVSQTTTKRLPIEHR